MKVKITEDVFYCKSLKRAGTVIDMKCDKKHLPFWAIPLNETEEIKKENKNGSPNTETEEEVLERLKDIAIENEIYIDINPDDTVGQSINKFQNILKQKGIKY